MEEKENKRVNIIVDDGTPENNTSGIVSKKERFTKPLIFVLMGIVFIGCLYLIFKPEGTDDEKKDIGLKNAVPEATDKGLQADKQKAYEKQLAEEGEAAKRNSLNSLSDYWNSSDSGAAGEVPASGITSDGMTGSPGNTGYQNSPLASYRNAQNTLSSFYQDDDREKLELRRQVDQLKERLSEKDVPATPTLNDQLTLMEKSYAMASKYLPMGAQTGSVPVDSTGNTNQTALTQNDRLEGVKGVRKNIVTALYREPDDQSFLTSMEEERNRSFITSGVTRQVDIVKNSIRATVMETQIISGEGSVKLRLQENAVLASHTVPKGTILVAGTKFQGNRLQLKISSVEVDGNILPVEIIVYDLNGQPGLSVPGSDEINAAGEIAGNMSQSSSGMNISMSSSAGQQVVGDLARSAIQGVSGYFSKKIRMTKVTLKAGHQVLLLAKK
ncbi:conjugative transposon protein TraM [Sphingobacterium sp. SRCM116780]|uniref:conjugative transposon protein TraM n=1 Tax=Sphingobacterium sp. SRCM116780 TaxID=2907623 RepID=UPI001F3D78AE|nr:conjugative transposon protein TraM [Sphingobacterium sp. SRCM116780]UIR57837.1 conjugative transposon protein TraM [Sphingobacterium sp. SRCM116780]